MSENIISLEAVRDARAGPDPQFRSTDQNDRPMLCFTASYQTADGKTWDIRFWAYCMEDAEARIEMMRDTLALDGQLIEEGTHS